MTLPRPNVTVIHSTRSGSEHVDVKIERDGKAREYHGESTSVGGAVGEVVRGILNDSVTAEWLP